MSASIQIHIQTAITTGKFDFKDSQFRNVLMLAIMYAEEENVIKLIHKISSGGQDSLFFERDQMGRNSLFYVVERGELALAQILMNALSGTGVFCQRGRLLSMKDQQGILPQEYAKSLGHLELFRLLSRELRRIEFFE